LGCFDVVFCCCVFGLGVVVDGCDLFVCDLIQSDSVVFGLGVVVDGCDLFQSVVG